MPYRFKHNEDIPTGIRRVLTEQCSRIQKELRSATPTSCDEPIHGARKRCKRIRALLRLIRPALGKDLYRRENRFFRDLARRIAKPRDALVIVHTWNHLVESWKEQPPIDDPELPAIVRAHLSEQYIESRHRTVNDHKQPAYVADEIAGFMDRLNEWPWAKFSWPRLAKGLQRQYRRNRKAMLAAKNNSSFDSYHEWRKKVKYLWHQVELIRPCRPGILSPFAKKLHNLSDCLGEDHDLAVLLNVLETTEVRINSADLDAVRSDIAGRQDRLRQHARKLGEQLYTESPRRFTEQITAYWREWKDAPDC